MRCEVAKRKEKRDRKCTSLHPHTFYFESQLDTFEALNDVSKGINDVSTESRKGKAKQLKIDCYHQLDKKRYSRKEKNPIETTRVKEKLNEIDLSFKLTK